VAAVSILFGFGHLYQGATGVADSTFTGLMAGLYLGSGRNLWVPILAHGLSDTIGLLLIFFDLVPELRR
jgi:membrane protease YdiL (CAAX protease family)